jgi:hypothetical protein
MDTIVNNSVSVDGSSMVMEDRIATRHKQIIELEYELGMERYGKTCIYNIPISLEPYGRLYVYFHIFWPESDAKKNKALQTQQREEVRRLEAERKRYKANSMKQSRGEHQSNFVQGLRETIKRNSNELMIS